jgi:hypothetical protein
LDSILICLGVRFSLTTKRTTEEGQEMMDVLYVIGSLAFFALMLAYVRACESLGHDAEHGEDRTP